MKHQVFEVCLNDDRVDNINFWRDSENRYHDRERIHAWVHWDSVMGGTQSVPMLSDLKKAERMVIPSDNQIPSDNHINHHQHQLSSPIGTISPQHTYTLRQTLVTVCVLPSNPITPSEWSSWDPLRQMETPYRPHCPNIYFTFAYSELVLSCD